MRKHISQIMPKSMPACPPEKTHSEKVLLQLRKLEKLIKRAYECDQSHVDAGENSLVVRILSPLKQRPQGVVDLASKFSLLKLQSASSGSDAYYNINWYAWEGVGTKIESKS